MGEDEDHEVALPQIDRGRDGADDQGYQDARDPLAKMAAGKYA